MDMKTLNSTTTVRGVRKFTIASIVCTLLCILGIILTTVVYDAINNTLQAGLRAHSVLESTESNGYGQWASSEDPNAPVIFTAFYVYNITNPDGILAGEKPNVTEIGPLTYYFKQQKANVTWDTFNDGDTLTYRQWQYYVPADANTAMLQTMNVTSINVPLMGALNSPQLRVLGGFLNDWLSGIQMGPDNPSALFVSRPMMEVLYGWEDPLLTMLSKNLPSMNIPTHYPGLQENGTSLASALANHGYSRMYTGKFTENLALWNSRLEMECCSFGPCGDTTAGGNMVLPWTTLEAEQIRGAFGDQFHTDVTEDDTLFVSTHSFGIYRHWPLANQGSYSLKGVNLLRFVLEDGVMGNASVNPLDAAAYNTFGPSGLLNQSQCEWGAPIFVSRPRFLYGSDSLREGLANLLPANPEDHDTYLGVEPYTGTTMDFRWRVGINIQLSPASLAGSTYFPNVQPVMMPIAWASRYGSASDSQASQLKSSVYLATGFMAAARWGGIVMAALSAICAVAFYIIASRRRQVLEAKQHTYTTPGFQPLLDTSTASGGASYMGSTNFYVGSAGTGY